MVDTSWLTEDNKWFVGTVLAALAIAIPAYITYRPSKTKVLPPITSHTTGITLEEYETQAKIRIAETVSELKVAHGEEKQILEDMLARREEALANNVESFAAYQKATEEQLKRLKEYEDSPDRDLIEQAEKALEEGRDDDADAIFSKIENNASEIIATVAEAAYQRHLIAKKNIDYFGAYNHIKRAVSLQSENTHFLNEAGFIAQKLADHKKAIDYYELALASYLKTYGEDHPSVARVRNNIGGVWHLLGDHKKAIDYYKLALASDLKTYGEDHPSVATVRNNIGTAWFSLGDYKKAIDYIELALASDLKTFGEVHPSVATRRNNIGSAWGSLGDHKKAIDYYELALASDLKTFGEVHPDVARDHNNIGSAWGSLGDHKKAIYYFELALKVVRDKLGPEHPNTVATEGNLTDARAALEASKN